MDRELEAFVAVLFVRPADAPSPLSILLPGRSAFRWAVLVLFAFMPLLSFWGWWDSYLSASLYSGNTNVGLMVAREDQGAGRTTTDLGEVSVDRLNVPVYPEEEVLTNLARGQCSVAQRPARVKFMLLGKPDFFTGERGKEAVRCPELLAAGAAHPDRR